MAPKPSPPKASAPKKASKLIEGQSSLAGFFSGGRLTPAARSKSDSQGSPSAGKKRKAEPVERKEVEQMNGPMTVSGHRPSASLTPSPSKKTEQRDDPSSSSLSSDDEIVAKPHPSSTKSGASGSKRSAPAKSGTSKYFGNGSSSSSTRGKSLVEAIDLEDSSDNEPPSKSRSAPAKTSKQPAKRKAATATVPDSSDDDVPSKKPKTKSTASPSRSKDAEVGRSSGKTSPAKAKTSPAKGGAGRKATASRVETEQDMDIDPPKAANASKSDSAANLKGKGEQNGTAKPATHNWRQAAAARANGPAAPGSKDIPQGKPNCLAGLTFVFTGELQSLSREDASDLARRYGAKVTTSPSSKTSYVVLGEGAGPSKLKAIEKNGLKTLDEDGFLALIADRGEGEPDKAALKKQEAEQNKLLAAAKELRKEVKQGSGGAPGAAIIGSKEHALWTSRYAPARMKDLVGNGTSIAKIEDWLTNWQASYKANFKKPGKNAIGVFRALLLSGPPGVGKTSAAHLLAHKCGYTPMELNASDARSKKLIEASLKDTINNASLDSWYNGTDKAVGADGVRVTDRTCLIMDEVDGMSGGDRGGVGAINALIRKTKVPILCICNEAKTPKMRPLESTCGQIKFARPDARQIRSRLLTIAFSEKMKVAPEVMDELIRSAQNDIRLVINMLSTWALSSRSMDFDEGKNLGAANIKPGMHTPFSLYNQVSGQGFFSATNPANLTQKSEVYFSDHSIMPLMVQTNYINQAPTIASRITNAKEKDWKTMELMTKAAISISDGEVIDAMIHSAQQHWSLMPHHAIASVIRPMSFVYGQSAAKNKMYGPAFPTWLGINSKAQRLSRVAVEIQTKMRLAASGSRFEVREQYLPYFVPRLTQPLAKKGQGGIEEVIAFMDDYYINPEDREGILELGVGDNSMDIVTKPIKTDVKSAFTRKYNSTDHPIAFYKGQNITKAKKLVGEPAPDVEELEGAEVSEVSDNDAEEVSDNEDFSKNKMIKEKKPKGKGKSGKSK